MAMYKMKEQVFEGRTYAHNVYLDGTGYVGQAYHTIDGHWCAEPAFGPGAGGIDRHKQFATAREAADYLASFYGATRNG